MAFLSTLAKLISPLYPMAKRWLYRFHGGIFPQYNKSLSTRNPIVPAILPSELILPLSQAVGEVAEPVVQVGDRVRKNQLIARSKEDAERKLVVAIHAPTSGNIVAIEPRTLAHPSGLKELCLVLQPDGQNDAIENALHSDGAWPQTPQALKKLLAESGIIGMGGAGFPTYAKLPNVPGKIHTLIINGAECEPFISCDDLLMQTQAQEILLGGQITANALGAQQLLCGIETNKPDAIAAIQQAITQLQALNQAPVPMQLMQVATVYPMGGQKQLVYEMTGIELQSGGHASDQGLLMMNVATLRAIYRAVQLGEPLTSRLVTVSGLGLESGFNVEALIGTPFDELAALARPKFPLDYPLIMGGPMMGVQMPNNHVPVLKTTNCILANPPQPREIQMPCIRCGECMDACPVNLLPQQMYWHAQGHEFDKVEKLNIKDCIECGCCSYVCPSHIPLVQYYRHAKAEIKQRHAEKAAAELAKQRHAFRLARLEREKAEREARLKAKKAAVKTMPAAATNEAATLVTENATTLSAREKAILAAQAAAARKEGQTDNDKKTKGQSLGTNKDKTAAAEAAKKRALEAAQKARATTATPKTADTPSPVTPQNARDKAIAAAKAAAAKKAVALPPLATDQITDLSANEGFTSTALQKEEARRAAVEAARANAKARKALKDSGTENITAATAEPSTPMMDARQKAIAAAKAAAAKRAQTPPQSDAIAKKDRSE
ncbi:MAG: electron transport complex subunit RsxC [Thiotrichales bacterium]|nr:electron transport complex subunit RsxC [Thiotrichales bacterium]